MEYTQGKESLQSLYSSYAMSASVPSLHDSDIQSRSIAINIKSDSTFSCKQRLYVINAEAERITIESTSTSLQIKGTNSATR